MSKNYTVRMGDECREQLERIAEQDKASPADVLRRLVAEEHARRLHGERTAGARRYRAKRKARAGRPHGGAGLPHGAVVDLLAAQLAEKDRQIQQMAEALRESMAATSEALRTAQAAQAIQAASRPGLIDRIRGFFSAQ